METISMLSLKHECSYIIENTEVIILDIDATMLASGVFFYL